MTSGSEGYSARKAASTLQCSKSYIGLAVVDC